MKNLLVLITAKPEDTWASELAHILQPLGRVKVVKQHDFSPDRLTAACELVIIDATALKGIMSSLIAELMHSDPPRRVVVMTASPNWVHARAAFEAGALDYLSKNLRPEEVFRNIQAAMAKPLPAKRGERERI